MNKSMSDQHISEFISGYERAECGRRYRTIFEEFPMGAANGKLREVVPIFQTIIISVELLMSK